MSGRVLFGELIEPDYPALFLPGRYEEGVHLNEDGARELSTQLGRYLAGERWGSVEDWLRQQREQARDRRQGPERSDPGDGSEE